jgi:ribosome-binding protein aMBF1 (putative translation factor)
MAADVERITGTDFEEDLQRRLQNPDFAAEYGDAIDRARLGVKIASLRAERGLSQTELAARLRTTQSVVSRYESADYTAYRMDTLRRLAEALDGELVVDIRPRRQSKPSKVVSGS